MVPAAEVVGATTGRTLICGLDLDNPGETAFQTEYFSPVLGVSELAGAGERFLTAAVSAANDRLRGTLGANIIVHPRTKRCLGTTFERSLADLRYGTIGVNAWTGVGVPDALRVLGGVPGTHPGRHPKWH